MSTLNRTIRLLAGYYCIRQDTARIAYYQGRRYYQLRSTTLFVDFSDGDRFARTTITTHLMPGVHMTGFRSVSTGLS